LSWQFAFCDEKYFTKEKIITIAKESVKNTGVVTADAKIIYKDVWVLLIEIQAKR